MSFEIPLKRYQMGPVQFILFHNAASVPVADVRVIVKITVFERNLKFDPSV